MSTDDAWSGRVIRDRYRLAGALGHGGMGRVYEATDLVTGSPIAMKLLHSLTAQDARAKRRFESEARTAASVRHPNVVGVFEQGELDDGTLFIAMEHIQGRDLKTVLQEKTLSIEQTLWIARQIAEALGAMHESGVVHRDLKPSNIMLLTEDDRPAIKVLDFGLAKFLEAPTDLSTAHNGRRSIARHAPFIFLPSKRRDSTM